MVIIHRLRQSILLGGDILSFVVGFWLALFARTAHTPSWELIERHISLFFIVFIIWILTNYINGLYDLEHQRNSQAFYRRFGETVGIALLVSIVFFYILPNRDINPKTILVLNVFFGYGLAALWRYFYNRYVNEGTLQTKVLFIGNTPEVQELVEQIRTEKEKGYDVVDIIDIDGSHAPEAHPLTDIKKKVSAEHISLVVVTPALRKNTEVVQHLFDLVLHKVEIVDLISFYEQMTGRIPPSTFSESWFLDHLSHTKKPVYDALRTVSDYIIGILLAGSFAVLFPFIALAIKLTSKGPIFYSQARVGKNGIPFILHKFRSMYALSEDGSAETDGVQFAKKGDARVTKVGSFLRKTRLDELPQFVNLLKREITFIGPRPERPEIVEQLEARMPYYSLRHVIRPGITGWAVLRQNYTDTLEASLEKLQYDLYYIKNRSIMLDLAIVLRTINIVLRAKGQ